MTITITVPSDWKKYGLFVAVFVTIAFSLSSKSAAQSNGLRLWGFDNSGFNSIWDLDTTTAEATNESIQATNNAVAEAEFGLGVFFAASTNFNTELFLLEPGTGALLDTVIMSFPDEGDVITAMEVIGGQLFGGLAIEGFTDTPDAHLVTIDPATGDVELVGGGTGIAAPLGGLAYDGSELYTVNSGRGGSATLYTVDINSGAATAVGDVLDEQGTPVSLTGLEFGNDGVLYALGRDPVNVLFSIDPATGSATTIGSITGTDDFNQSLTTVPVPEPGALVLVGLMLGCLGLCGRKT